MRNFAISRIFFYLIDRTKLVFAILTVDRVTRAKIERWNSEYGCSIHVAAEYPKYFPEYYGSYKEWKKVCG